MSLTPTQRADLLQWGRNFRVAESGGEAGLYGLAAVLQWGRNFRVAERTQRFLPLGDVATLQWGRNFRVAESRVEKPAPDIGQSFNGAATLGLRKDSKGLDNEGKRGNASMGPQL